MQDKISLAGDLGSGKSTVSDLLIAALGAEYYSTGAIVRSIADKRGMTVEELNRYMETHPEIDHEIDDGLAALSDVDKFLIIDSRMAWHFTKGTFRVYLSTDAEVSALRILNAGRKNESFSDLSAAIAGIRARRESEKKRYFEQYGVKIKDLSNYDLVLDTTYVDPGTVAEVITSSLAAWREDKSRRFLYVCPERLYFPDDAPDGDAVAKLSDWLSAGSPIPEVKVFEEDGNFYLSSGLESALAYALAMRAHIPATLVPGSSAGKKYTRMKNSL